MATVVQATSIAQTRTPRATPPWPPPSGMYTRPWRSSPLAGPAFSTLPPVILESSEESQEGDIDDSARTPPRARSISSLSIISQTGSLSASASGYDRSRNNSSSASALFLVDGDASTSSVSLTAGTGAHGTSSSHGHTSSQSYPSRPKRPSKLSRPTSAQGNFAAPKNVVDITPTPRPRTVSHGHPRPASLPAGAAPPIYSRPTRSMFPAVNAEHNTVKQPPSASRDPSSNWMSSSPFGPAETPKFSRLAMASPAVVMPLSAREYRKQKARESTGNVKQKEQPTFSHRVTFIDNPASTFQKLNGVPVVKVSPPPSEDVRRAPSSSGDHSSADRRGPSQPQVDLPPSQPLPQTAMSPRPSSPTQRRPRSRPNTPPRSSPLAAHPPISPKSSAGTFYSCASSSDDDPNLTPARPRPRRRRRSYPDRLSNGARLSLLEAMNRLSQESTSLQRLSVSHTNEAHRLSVASQASGHTLFYDMVDESQVTAVNGHTHVDAPPRSSAVPVATQSLEDLSLTSTRARTGIEVIDGRAAVLDPDDQGRKAKRNVRMVRISDKVEVSPPPVPRRRRLTKSRPGSSRGSMTVPGPPGLGTVKEAKPQSQSQNQDRLSSLLPWKSKGSSPTKSGVVAAGGRVAAVERSAVTPTKATPATAVPDAVPPIANGSAHLDSHAKPVPNGSAKKMASPLMTPSPGPASAPSTSRTSRRYTFSFLPSPAFHRPKREKSNTAPPNVEPSKVKGIIKLAESGTDSTSTSIRTITQGSQSTLVPTYDLTTPTISGASSGPTDSGRGSRSSVPMMRRVTAQEMAAAASQGGWEGTLRGDYSTPSLITNGSTSSAGSSSPHTPSGMRLVGEFVPRPSGLKASYTDTSEEESEGMPEGGRTSRLCMHRKHPSSPLARWGETSEADERYLRPGTSRPGTASSTATETSGSYISFSTVPASTTSSRSASPTLALAPAPVVVGDKRDQDWVGEEIAHACAMCGHQLPSPVPMPEMHPMFTVPLVTVPVSSSGRSPGGSEVRVPRYAKKHKSERHASVPVLPAAAVVVGGVPPARHDPSLSPMSNGVAVMPKAPRTTAIPDMMPMPMPIPTMVTPPQLPSPPVSPHKVRKRHRPQTAPAGTGEVAVKFIEEAKAMRRRDGSVDALVGATVVASKPRPKGESRFKATLKGLFRWAS